MHKLPENPIEFIKSCVKARRLYWTYHVNMRIKERSIPRKWILLSVEQYEIIEIYPEDKYMPSYLVWSEFNERVFHIVFAADIEAENVRIVTAYKPDSREWTCDMKQRIKK